jgi:hypothetical protein
MKQPPERRRVLDDIDPVTAQIMGGLVRRDNDRLEILFSSCYNGGV